MQRKRRHAVAMSHAQGFWPPLAECGDDEDRLHRSRHFRLHYIGFLCRKPERARAGSRWAFGAVSHALPRAGAAKQNCPCSVLTPVFRARNLDQIRVSICLLQPHVLVAGGTRASPWRRRRHAPGARRSLRHARPAEYECCCTCDAIETRKATRICCSNTWGPSTSVSRARPPPMLRANRRVLFSAKRM